MGKTTIERLLEQPYKTLKSRVNNLSLEHDFNRIYFKWVRTFGHDNFVKICYNIPEVIKDNPNVSYYNKLRILDGSCYNYYHWKRVGKFLKEEYK